MTRSSATSPPCNRQVLVTLLTETVGRLPLDTRNRHTVAMTNHAPITLTRHLHVDEQDEAVYLLQRYYAGLIAGNASGFEGGHWDGFDPSGTREASPDEFTADDLLSASLLSADIPPAAMVKILWNDCVRKSLSKALHALDEDRDLADLTDAEVRELERTSTIWPELRSIGGLGPTRTSKLIARKRPRLIPIYDSVVGQAVYGGTSRGYWTRLHAELTANRSALHRHLVSLREQAGLEERVSPLRIFDVIAWLDASGKGDELLARRSEERSAARR